MLDRLNEKNSYTVYDIDSAEFKSYGRILNIDVSDIVSVMENQTVIPSENNIYVASDENLENTKSYKVIKNAVYGGLDIQIGYCNGNSNKLNALEYHCGSEINVAVTDMVLFLATQDDIVNNQIDTKSVKAFFIPEGTVIELYQGILHFAPAKTSDLGFKCVVVLLRGTNGELEEKIDSVLNSKYLFKHNKWIYVHEDRQDIIYNGGKQGLNGENYIVKY